MRAFSLFVLTLATCWVSAQRDASDAEFESLLLGPPRDSSICPGLGAAFSSEYAGSQPAIDKVRIWQGARKGAPRILCGIYTNAGSLSKYSNSTTPRYLLQKAIMDTW